MKADRRDRGTEENAFGPLWTTGGRDFHRPWAKVPVLMTSECRIDGVWRPGAGIVLIEMSGGGSAR